MENEEHRPLLYRPEGESRHTVPAEVCDTCSDFDTGNLVPVSFCQLAASKLAASSPIAGQVA